jgi:hypothetical protein
MSAETWRREAAQRRAWFFYALALIPVLIVVYIVWAFASIGHAVNGFFALNTGPPTAKTWHPDAIAYCAQYSSLAGDASLADSFSNIVLVAWTVDEAPTAKVHAAGVRLYNDLMKNRPTALDLTVIAFDSAPICAQYTTTTTNQVGVP